MSSFELFSPKRRSADSIIDFPYQNCTRYIRWDLFRFLPSLSHFHCDQRNSRYGGRCAKSPIIGTIVSSPSILSVSLMERRLRKKFGSGCSAAICGGWFIYYMTKNNLKYIRTPWIWSPLAVTYFVVQLLERTETATMTSINEYW